MLKKENRLTKDKEFDKVFKEGLASYDKMVGVRVLANSFQHIRIGVIVNSKVSKSSVVRNKIKRQLRDIFGKEIQKISLGFDIVVLALPEIYNKTSKEIEKSIKNQLKKLDIY